MTVPPQPHEGSLVPLPIPGVGIPKGIAALTKALISTYPLAAPASQPPTPNKLFAGGWEVKGRRLIRKSSTGSGVVAISRIWGQWELEAWRVDQ